MDGTRYGGFSTTGAAAGNPSSSSQCRDRRALRTPTAEIAGHTSRSRSVRQVGADAVGRLLKNAPSRVTSHRVTVARHDARRRVESLGALALHPVLPAAPADAA